MNPWNVIGWLAVALIVVAVPCAIALAIWWDRQRRRFAADFQKRREEMRREREKAEPGVRGRGGNSRV